MKLELKENMYYRTYSGFINKITSIKDFNEREYLLNGFYINKDTIKKASYNIIDILEVGDILIDDTNRKLEILLIDDELMVRNTGLIYDNNYYLPIKSIAIKLVITHEQMEQRAYKVGE